MELKEVELRVECDDGTSFVGQYISLDDVILDLRTVFDKHVVSDVRLIPVYINY